MLSMQMEKSMESSSIIWYNSIDMFHSKRGNSYAKFEHMPGFNTFRHMFGFFAANFSTTDRTNTIRVPVKTQLLPQCALPEFKKIDYNFAELCEKRARWLLDHAISTNRKLAIMYSGGVDSTLIMVSLLKIATDKELNENVLVILSQNSIMENPKFYREYILKRCKLESSYVFHAYLGNDKYVVVNGECGDQLFGSAINGPLIKDRGYDFVFAPPDTNKIIDLFNAQAQDYDASEKIITTLNKVVAAAPVKIETLYHYFWWINFALKWQSVYARSIGYTDARYQTTVKAEENFFTFFNTPEMQLWSMNNIDKLIKDTWKSYKYICKDIIYDFNGDEDYRDNKLKVGSLQTIVATKPIAKAIGSDWKFYMDEYPDGIWDMENDFV